MNQPNALTNLRAALAKDKDFREAVKELSSEERLALVTGAIEQADRGIITDAVKAEVSRAPIVLAATIAGILAAQQDDSASAAEERVRRAVRQLDDAQQRLVLVALVLLALEQDDQERLLAVVARLLKAAALEVGDRKGTVWADLALEIEDVLMRVAANRRSEELS